MTSSEKIKIITKSSKAKLNMKLLRFLLYHEETSVNMCF